MQNICQSHGVSLVLQVGLCSSATCIYFCISGQQVCTKGVGSYFREFPALGMANVPTFFCFFDDDMEPFPSAFRLLKAATALSSHKLTTVVLAIVVCVFSLLCSGLTPLIELIPVEGVSGVRVSGV